MAGKISWDKVDHESEQHSAGARWPRREVLDLWKAHSGEWHGPHVETVTMPMYLLQGFLDEYVGNALAAAEGREAALRKENDRLREALEPFARAHHTARTHFPGSVTLAIFGAVCAYYVSAVDFQRAARAVAEPKP